MLLTAHGICRSSRPSSLIRIWRRGQRRSCGPNSAADMLLCDTGVLLAAGNVKDHHHAACLTLMRAAEGPLLVPSPVLGEIGYLLQSRVGPHAEVTFLKSFGGNGFHVADGRRPRSAGACRAARRDQARRRPARWSRVARPPT